MSEIPTPERVEILDTTLRDGIQSPGIALTTEQSLGIAQQLNRLGVDIIEAGYPLSSPGNFQAVQTIAQQVEGPVIAALARTEVRDIREAANALKDAPRPRIHTFIATSDIHIEHQLKSTREDVIGQTRAGVAHAKEYVDDVQFSPMDATRADIEFTAEVCQTAIDEGATTINIPDTVGYTEPDEFRDYLARLRQYVPALGTAGVVLSVHCHNDLGMAVANSLAGVKAGARQVESTVNGIGERTGNASEEEVIMALDVRRDIYGVYTGINADAIAATSRMVARYTGYKIPRTKPIVGANAFAHESGLHQDGVLKERSTYEIMTPESVGRETDGDGIVLGRQSGSHAVRHVLEQEGAFRPEVMRDTFKMFKEVTDQVGGISREQAVEIHEEAWRRKNNPYTLQSYDVSASSQKGEYSAGVSVGYTGRNQEMVWAKNDLNHPLVDGATSALFTALKNAACLTGGQDVRVKFMNFGLHSIGEGEGALGKATVNLRVNGKAVVGHGLAFDTTEASGWAYLDAIQQGL